MTENSSSFRLELILATFYTKNTSSCGCVVGLASHTVTVNIWVCCPSRQRDRADKDSSEEASGSQETELSEMKATATICSQAFLRALPLRTRLSSHTTTGPPWCRGGVLGVWKLFSPPGLVLPSSHTCCCPLLPASQTPPTRIIHLPGNWQFVTWTQWLVWW